MKGVFSPLSGSAFSYEYEDRGKLASMLFAETAEEFAAEGIYSCGICRYAHDEETAKSFVLNGFGIRCMDAIQETERVALKAEGVTHLGVDCETMNPTALRFWTKSFLPYTYSFARRIDEKV